MINYIPSLSDEDEKLLEDLCSVEVTHSKDAFCTFAISLGKDIVFDFRKADLRGFDLRGQDLRDTDLTEADLRGADLRGANLSKVTGWGSAVKTGARINRSTILPEKASDAPKRKRGRNPEFYRIKRLPPYVFAEVNELKATGRAAGRDVVDLGMGNPDGATPPHIVAKLVEAVQDPKAHGYSASKGIPGLRHACAGYYARRFNVELDPEREIIVTLGSTEGFANLAQAMTAPGDTVIVPNPSSPIHSFGFIMAGAAVRHVPIGPGVDFLDELKKAIKHSIPAPLAIVLNFPANPTAMTVDLDFYGEIVDFCRHHGIWILSDLAYAEIYFDDKPPPSIFEVPGARDIAVEFTSLSTTYSMAGWRMGFAVGNERLISALTRVKSNLDDGAFTPIQIAAIAALNGPQDCIAEIRERYKARRDVLVDGLRQAGWEIPAPNATMFAWAPVPQEYKDLGSLAFSTLLLERANVLVSPGVSFGEYGEGFVRIALVENRQRLRQATRNIKAFLRERTADNSAAK